MKTAVIYARYSSNSQTEQSIEGQLRVCNEYAQRNDIIIVGEYIDRAMTGTNDKRPDFQKMIADSSKKKWDYVLVYRFDRFSRNIYEQIFNENTLEKNGVKLISATEYIPDASSGSFMKGMIINFNDYYSKELSEKVRRGMRETRIKGNFQGGVTLYGYKVQDHKILIDEEKAEVVRFIFEQYANGFYVCEIIDQLTQKGILAKGNKPFHKNTIYNILRNEKYSGIYKFKDEIFDNMYPQIVPFDIYEKVKQKQAKNRVGSRSVRLVYLFRHKMICGYCGLPVTAECGNGKNGKKLCYYKCSGRKKRLNNCTKTTERKEELEEYIVNALISKLKNPEIMNALVKTLMKIQNNQNECNTLLSSLKKEKAKLNTSLENIMNAIECGVFNNTTNKRMKEIEERLQEIEYQIIAENSKADIKLSEIDIKKFYQFALNQESRMLVDYLIKEIKLFDDKIEITLNNALRNSDNQSFSFYKKLATKPNSENLYLRFTLELFV